MPLVDFNKYVIIICNLLSCRGDHLTPGVAYTFPKRFLSHVHNSIQDSHSKRVGGIPGNRVPRLYNIW